MDRATGRSVGFRSLAAWTIVALLCCGCSPAPSAPPPVSTGAVAPTSSDVAPSATAPSVAALSPAPSASSTPAIACRQGDVTGTVAQWASSKSGGGGAYALIQLNRAGDCTLSALRAMRLKDSTGTTIAKHTAIAVPMQIAVAIWADFISVCPTERSTPLSVTLEFGGGVVAKIAMPGGFVVTCADGSSRAFVDGVVEATAHVPSPGGTCSASQFTLGAATTTYGGSTAFDRVLEITQPMHNTGAACVLELPGVVAVASATGTFQPVSIGPAENSVSFRIGSGASPSIELRAWFPIDLTPGAFGGPTCRQALQDVTRLQFPMASGSVDIHWDTAIPEVCSAPTAMSETIGDP
ncbi:MAG: hypothetical protein QOI92_1186 [Chloroflexota bacterium]|nr:hypothetical protein [Chloroflexota bacterium]